MMKKKTQGLKKDLSDDNSTSLETIIEETNKRRAKKQRAKERRTKKPMRIKCETLECAVKDGLNKGFINIIGFVLSLEYILEYIYIYYT